MEDNDIFKKMEAKIKSLEQQLSQCDETIKLCEQSGTEVEEQIEEHFTKCINALAERKVVLLHEASQRVANQKKVVEETRVKVLTSIEAVKLTLKATSATYDVSPSTAEIIWKGLLSAPSLKVSCVRVAVTLPSILFHDIQTYGEVEEYVDYDRMHEDVMDTKRFSTAEMVTTVAGSGTAGYKDGKGPRADFRSPYGMCMNDDDQCLYICDNGNKSIRKLSLRGVVTTFVEQDAVKDPYGIAMHHQTKCFYVTTVGSHAINKITSSGTVSHFAGGGLEVSPDGVGSGARFNYPRGITIDQQTGNLFVCDCYHYAIRKITPEGEVSTLAGSEQGFADGNGKTAMFWNPDGICFDEDSQSVLVCDNGNNKLRRVQMNGDVSTLCDIQQPRFIALTANRTIIVSSGDYILRKVTRQGSQAYKVEILAGSGEVSCVDGRPDECSFYYPQGIVVHEASHSCFIGEQGGHVIRRISFSDTN